MKDGKVFMARRKPGKSLAGFWEFQEERLNQEKITKQHWQESSKRSWSLRRSSDFIATGHTKGEEVEINLHGYFIDWDAERQPLQTTIKWAGMGTDDVDRLKIPEADLPILDALSYLL